MKVVFLGMVLSSHSPIRNKFDSAPEHIGPVQNHRDQCQETEVDRNYVAILGIYLSADSRLRVVRSATFNVPGILSVSTKEQAQAFTDGISALGARTVPQLSNQTSRLRPAQPGTEQDSCSSSESAILQRCDCLIVQLSDRAILQWCRSSMV